MKTALKIIGGIVGTLAAAVAVFYFGWLSPPSPESVCENVMKVTKAELAKSSTEAGEAQLAELEKSCIATAGREPEFGRGPWVKRLKCMRDAEDMSTLDKCNDIRSM